MNDQVSFNEELKDHTHLDRSPTPVRPVSFNEELKVKGTSVLLYMPLVSFNEELKAYSLSPICGFLCAVSFNEELKDV